MNAEELKEITCYLDIVEESINGMVKAGNKDGLRIIRKELLEFQWLLDEEDKTRIWKTNHKEKFI